MARLPLCPVECRHCGNDAWQSRAAGGQTIRCPACGKPKRMPADRPRTDAEARAASAPGALSIGTARLVAGGPDPALVRAWADVPEYGGSFTGYLRPDPRAGKCPDCGVDRLAEPWRTLAYCLPCDQLGEFSVTAERRAKRSARPADGHGDGAGRTDPEDAARTQLELAESKRLVLSVLDPLAAQLEAGGLHGRALALALLHGGRIDDIAGMVTRAHDHGEIMAALNAGQQWIDEARRAGALLDQGRARAAARRQAQDYADALASWQPGSGDDGEDEPAPAAPALELSGDDSGGRMLHTTMHRPAAWLPRDDSDRSPGWITRRAAAMNGSRR